MTKLQRLVVAILLSTLGFAPQVGRAQACSDALGSCPPTTGACLTWVDLTTYFVPSYAGWQTARLTEQFTPTVSITYDRKYLYGVNRLAHIKFNDPSSVETYTWDNDWIYLTAENGINGTAQSRVFPTGSGLLGLIWMPRYACSKANPAWTVSSFNVFSPCYSAQVFYNNCNSCPCQLGTSDPQHCAVHPSRVVLTNYNFGGSIGTIPTVIKQDTTDDGSESEWYYYGQGYGFLRYEAYDAQGQLITAEAEIGETPNDPLADQACFHP